MSAFTFKKNGADITNLVLTPSDFTNGIWHSDEKALTNITTVIANIRYAELTPDGENTTVDFRLQAVVEGKENDGSWVSLVRQNNAHFRSSNAEVKRLIVTEAVSDFEQGREHIIPDALGNEAIAISHEQIAIPDDIRLCIVLADLNSSPPNAALTSVKLTATGVLK